MMINGVSFTGRETMFAKGLKSAGEDIAVKTYEYLGAGKIFKNAEKEQLVSKIDYRSPFEPVGGLNSEQKTGIFEVLKDLTSVQQMEKSYAISHGTPESIVAEHIGKNINYIG